jgi:Zn-dependent M16 (insulinase) family peptidase
VQEKLEEIRSVLVNRSRLVCNVTLDEANWQAFRPELEGFLKGLPAAPALHTGWNWSPDSKGEGLTIPAQVNYVGKGANLYELDYVLDGSINVILNYLRTTWLWERVRVQGGAYGGFCVFDRHSGVITFLSYRDPNLMNTLKTYDDTAAFLKNLDLSQEELTKSIIGVIGDLDAYQLPDAKGYTSLVRYLVGETDEERQLLREQVLDTRPEDFQAFAGVIEQVRDAGRVVVLGWQDAIQQANQELDGKLDVKRVL